MRYSQVLRTNGSGNVTITRQLTKPDGKLKGEVRAVVDRLARMQIRPDIDAATKTVNTPAGPLPVSPLMDPAFIEARRRHHLPKPPPDLAKHGRFERQFARNPYAHALATSIRYDHINRIQLPRFFLQGFNFIAHPETGEPWMVPHDLLPVSYGGRDAQEAEGEEGVVPSRDDASPLSNPGAGEGESSGTASRRVAKGSSKPRRPARPSGRAGYILSRRSLVETLVRLDGKQKKGNRHRLAAIAGFQGSVCREDMDSFVLDLMREKVVGQLLYFAKLCEGGTSAAAEVGGPPSTDGDGEEGSSARKYLVSVAGWGELRTIPQRGCVLWLGGSKYEGSSRTPCDPPEPMTESPSVEEAPGDMGPGEFATVDIEGVRSSRTIPVHDLTVLLGQDKVDYIRGESSLLSQASMFHLGRRRTIDLQLMLWKLQGYLAEYKPVQ